MAVLSYASASPMIAIVATQEHGKSPEISTALHCSGLGKVKLTCYREGSACKLVQADSWRGLRGREGPLLDISGFEAAADGQL